MLEALLPFVPSNLKLPLAMLIKWNEYKRMMSVFQNPELLKQYGLMEDGFSLQALKEQFAGCPNEKLAAGIRQMGQMMQMFEMMKMMEGMTDPLSGFSDLQSSDSDFHFPDFSEDTPYDNNPSMPDDNKTSVAQTPDQPEPDLEDFNIDEFIEEVFS